MKIKVFKTDNESKLAFFGEYAMEYKKRDFVEEQNHPGDVEAWLLNIHRDVEYQTYGGIGGALTESSCVALKNAGKERSEEILKAYFDKDEGIGYNFCRLSIGSCDFSVGDYSYVNDGDYELKTFDISHDLECIIPTLKRAQKYNGITFFASPWSAPAFMKTGNSKIGGHLKKDCYKIFANYVAKFVKAYKDNGINVWGVTIQNEPRHHQIWESCLYSEEEESEYLGELGKALKGENVKILCYDHCRERTYERLKFIKEGKNGKYLDGVAHHWYSGDHFGELKAVYRKYPDMINVASESCVGVYKEGINADSELSTAEAYAHDIIGAFYNGLNYYADWVMVLDEKNGPYYNRVNRGAWVDALVYADNTNGVNIYRLGYYYVGHISKFVTPGAKVISSSSYNEKLECVAFKNPDGKIVLVVLNKSDSDLKAVVRMEDFVYEDQMQKHSIKTYIIED